MKPQSTGSSQGVATGVAFETGWMPAPAASLDHDVPLEADEAEKAEQVLEVSCCLSEEADEAERTEEVTTVARRVLSVEAEEAERAEALYSPPPLGLVDEPA